MALKQNETPVTVSVQTPAEQSSSSAACEIESPRPARSPAQQAASRANAKHSTGPRTKAGKAAARMNAMKHGCYSNEFTGYCRGAYGRLEDGDVYNLHLQQVRYDLRRKYRPGDPEEAHIVDLLAMLWHRLWRLQLAAQSAVRWADEDKRSLRDAFVESEKLQPQEARLECSIQRQRKALAFLQRMRLGHEPRWGSSDFTPEEEAALAKAEREHRRMERFKPAPPSEARTGEASTVNSSLPSSFAPGESFMDYCHPLGDGEVYGPPRPAHTAWYPPSERPSWGPGSGRDGQWTLAERWPEVAEARHALAQISAAASKRYPENEGTNPSEGTGEH